MRRLLLVVVWLGSACAVKSTPSSFAVDTAKAAALMNEGCHACLAESLALYQKALTSTRPPVDAAERAFDAAVLVALREKELGIPGTAAMDRARRLVVPSRRAVLDAAELVIGDTSGLDPDERTRLTAGRQRVEVSPDNPVRRALDGAPATDLAANYVALSIDCEHQKLIDGVDGTAIEQTYAGSPLVRFRLATCGRPGSSNVGDLRAATRDGSTRSIGKAAASCGHSAGRPSTFPRPSATTQRRKPRSPPRSRWRWRGPTSAYPPRSLPRRSPAMRASSPVVQPTAMH